MVFLVFLFIFSTLFHLIFKNIEILGPDENQDFKRAMNVNNVPHTFIINGKGEIVWSHNSYSDGDEDVLYENIKALIKGEKLKH
jgi:biopolymer transport protein ExbD